MHVESVGNHPQGNLNATAKKASSAKAVEPRIETPAIPAQNDQINQDSGDKQPGVLRLLEEGHFKGVADVRLRINFFDQLSARANANTVANLPAAAETLIGQVTAESQNVIGTMNLDEETAASAQKLAEEFQTAVNTAATEATANGSLDRESLQTGLQAAFDTFLSGLRSLTAPPPPVPQEPSDNGIAITEQPSSDTPTDAVTTPDNTSTDVPPATDPSSDTPATNAGAEPTSEVGSTPVPSAEVTTEQPTSEPIATPDPFASLVDMFAQAVAAMNESLTAQIRLPDPAPSPGHGSAYDKFLAIYNQMRDGTSSPSYPPDTPGIELSA